MPRLPNEVMSKCLLISGIFFVLPHYAFAENPLPKLPTVQSNIIEGEVSKDRLESFLKAGPHALIRSFLVEPAYKQKRFLGFKIVQRTTHPVIATNALVKVGDIVVAANGTRLETPAQFMSAWRKLRERKVFAIELLRNGEKMSYRWTLVD